MLPLTAPVPIHIVLSAFSTGQPNLFRALLPRRGDRPPCMPGWMNLFVLSMPVDLNEANYNNWLHSCTCDQIRMWLNGIPEIQHGNHVQNRLPLRWSGDFRSADVVQSSFRYLFYIPRTFLTQQDINIRSCVRTMSHKDDLVLLNIHANLPRDGLLQLCQSLRLHFFDIGCYSRTESHMRYSWLPQWWYIILWRQFLLWHTVIIHHLCRILQARSKL